MLHCDQTAVNFYPVFFLITKTPNSKPAFLAPKEISVRDSNACIESKNEFSFRQTSTNSQVSLNSKKLRISFILVRETERII